MFELILVVVSFIGGCVATFYFARTHKTRFFSWMTSDKDDLVKTVQTGFKNKVDQGKKKLKSKL